MPNLKSFDDLYSFFPKQGPKKDYLDFHKSDSSYITVGPEHKGSFKVGQVITPSEHKDKWVDNRLPHGENREHRITKIKHGKDAAGVERTDIDLAPL